jgi:alkylation response protein AidB-like acyl-CoA dehydrogenase
MTTTIESPRHTNGAAPVQNEATVSPASRYQLQAETGAGKRLVAIAEELAGEFAVRAGEHDREGSYPFEAIEALKERRYFSAPFPVELGGLGVSSVRDILIASSRLARGDASVTIGINMHLATVGNMARRYQIAVATGGGRRVATFGGAMLKLSQSGAVIAAGISEAGQDLLRPNTRAARTQDGWAINGRKIFCTMSPAASTIMVAVTAEDPDRGEIYSYAMVPADSPGIVYHDDWDALGMRASGSQSVSFENVALPEAAIRGGFPVGEAAPYMERNLTAGAFHAAASLGIAEAAHQLAVTALASRRREGASESATNLILASQNSVELSSMRAIFDRAGRLIDAYYAEHPTDDGTPEEIAAAFAEVQTAKVFINEGSVRVVDRALTLSGGAGYMNKSPLSRAYRDARAGAFMHPLGANRAHEFIGRVALGLGTSLS